MKYILIISLLLLSIGELMSQTGRVRGTLYDGSSGETIPYATIYVESDRTVGTSTDLDGTFELELSAGSHDLTFSYVGYNPTTIQDIKVNENGITVLHPKIEMGAQTLTEVVVSSIQMSNTESSLLTLRRKSPNVIDGVSRELFSKSGDGDAGAAIKRVTGVSIVDGKHILVRGLGDRYSKTILNGSDIPGLDPDKNSVQIDLFPTQLIENIMVSKTFLPELPGDFTGGLVNIKTREFPENPTLSISGSIGYNPIMNLNDRFLSYQGSSTDFLGWDNGLRKLPLDKNASIPDPVMKDPALSFMTQKFDPQMDISLGKSPVNQSYSIIYGNQYNLGAGKLGIIATANYKNSYKFYQDIEYNTYLKYPEKNINNLFSNRSIKGDRGDENVLLSGMAGVNYKLTRSKFGLNWLHIQNGVSSAARLTQITSETNPSTLKRTNLEYKQRALDHIRLSGKHNLGENKWEIDWKFSQTRSSIDEPDNRITAFEMVPRVEDISYELNPSVGAGVNRIWRNLQEQNYTGHIDVLYQFDLNSQRTSELKFGFASSLKDRDYTILNYLFRVERSSQIAINGNPDNLFRPENIWDPSARIGTYVKGNFEPANTYQANQMISAGYVMNELPLTKKLKSIYGLRMEHVINRYTGQNNLGDITYDNQEVLDEMDFLPSLNLLYEYSDKINLRLSANRTLARPTFKEKSLAQIQDLISGRTFIGNIDLKETRINNFDIRFENYFDWGELFSVSGFYKKLVDPIELIAYSDASPDDVQPRNSSEADVMGVELEIRKKLKFLGGFADQNILGGNLSFIRSKVKMGTSEYESRVQNARSGETIDKSRPLVDQAPVIANIFLQYTSLEKMLNLNLSYNYQGKQLTIVGIGRNSDVYTLPYHSLNFNARFKIGASNKIRLSLSVLNVLDQDRIQVYESFGTSDNISEKYRPGRTISLGLSLDL